MGWVIDRKRTMDDTKRKINRQMKVLLYYWQRVHVMMNDIKSKTISN